jgi:tRNA-Thr(GGU) m(6)t(6)A37 methyltransferase TsaA
MFSLKPPASGKDVCMSPTESMTLSPIAIVHSPFTSVEGMPIQSAASGEAGSLLVFPEYAQGLADLDGFEYLILVTYLHAGRKEALQVVPFLDDTPRGIFATRSPARPNRLGLSIVRLQSIDGLELYFTGNDMLDQTPVLDIKPYVPAFDVRHTERVGWYGDRLERLPHTRSDMRMTDDE